MLRKQIGFTLIELLLVIAIISLLIVFLVPKGIEALDQAKVTACQQNLLQIYEGFQLFETRFQNNAEFEEQAGVKFFLKLWHYKVWEHTESSARKLTCPAVKYAALPGLAGRKPEQWFDDWDLLDGSYSAYAGRDIVNYPLRRMSDTEPLVCDDNDGAMNHPHITNVLMGGGSVKTFDNVLLQQEGVLGETEEVLRVGPDSPVEMLQKFSLD